MPKEQLFYTPQGEIPVSQMVARGRVSPAFPDKKLPILDVNLVLDSVQQRQDQVKKEKATQNSAEVIINTSLPWIAITGTGDWHLGNEGTDYKLWRDHMDKFRDVDGLYCVVVGDERDNFVIPKFRSGLFEGLMSPQEQSYVVQSKLQELDDKGKIIARAGGNHDGWTFGETGISLEDYWYRQMKSPLLKDGGFVSLKANGVDYKLYIHHGLSLFNSNFNPNHASKRAFEFQGPFDVSYMGHTHQTEVAHGYRWNDEFTKDYVQVRTGTYKADDDWARSRQMGRGQKPGATVLYSTVERHILPFINLDDAVQVMKALNNEQRATV